MLSEKEFSNLFSKLQLGNPQSDIQMNHRSTKVIWSDTPASELVVPPTYTVIGDCICNNVSAQQRVKVVPLYESVDENNL